MKLKQKLMISFLASGVLPICLIMFAALGIMNRQADLITGEYGIKTSSMQLFMDPMRVFNRTTRNSYTRLKNMAIENSMMLTEPEYLRETNQEFAKKGAFIIIRKNDEFLYAGDEKRFALIRNKLPAFGVYSTGIDGGIYLGSDTSLFVKQQDFYFTDKTNGSFFVVCDLNTLFPSVKALFLKVSFAAFCIILLSSVLMSMWIYQDYVKPIGQLQLAANRIKDGNLQDKIEPVGSGEILNLSRDFEEMRIHLKGMLQEILQTRENSRRMVANISHDLMTPLTVIKGFTEGLLDGIAATAEKKNHYLRTIYEKAALLTSLVEELSFYAKLGEDKIPYHFCKISVRDFLNSVITKQEDELKKRGFDVEIQQQIREDSYLLGDEVQLGKVMEMLVDNTLKYKDEERPEKIRLFVTDQVQKELVTDVPEGIQPEKCIYLELEDNGRGILPGEETVIFEQFYRGDFSRTSGSGGSGLGLPLCRKIIEAHEGKIWVKRKTQGLIICLLLPKY